MKQTKLITEPELLVNDAHSIYIPQLFVKAYRNYIVDADKIAEELNILENGPDSEDYWETLDDLLMNGLKITNDFGQVFHVDYLPESSDLWAIPEGYEYSESF